MCERAFAIVLFHSSHSSRWALTMAATIFHILAEIFTQWGVSASLRSYWVKLPLVRLRTVPIWSKHSNKPNAVPNVLLAHLPHACPYMDVLVFTHRLRMRMLDGFLRTCFEFRSPIWPRTMAATTYHILVEMFMLVVKIKIIAPVAHIGDQPLASDPLWSRFLIDKD